MFHCDKIQGNFFSGPIAPGEIPDLFQRHGQQNPGRSWYQRHNAGGGR